MVIERIKKMARTYNVVKYVIKKNINDFKIHGLRLYEFNIKAVSYTHLRAHET